MALLKFEEAEVCDVYKQLKVSGGFVEMQAFTDAVRTVVGGFSRRVNGTVSERSHDQPVAHQCLELRRPLGAFKIGERELGFDWIR